jgi:acyl carrier protein
MEAEALEREIRTFLEEKLGITELDRNTELISSGLVDSGNLVRLATRLERAAGIVIPDRDIDVDHFDSLAMIVDYALSKARPEGR